MYVYVYIYIYPTDQNARDLNTYVNKCRRAFQTRAAYTHTHILVFGLSTKCKYNIMYVVMAAVQRAHQRNIALEMLKIDHFGYEQVCSCGG